MVVVVRKEEWVRAILSVLSVRPARILETLCDCWGWEERGMEEHVLTTERARHGHSSRLDLLVNRLINAFVN